MSVTPTAPGSERSTDKDLPTATVATTDTDKVYTEKDLQDRLAELRKNESATMQAENDELRNQLKLRDAREEITGLLRNAGARSPELLFNSSKDSLQFDSNGKVANSAALVEQLKRSFPEQFGSSVPAGSIDGAAGRSERSDYLTKEKLQKMTPAEIARLDWQEVRKVLSEG